MCRAVLVNAVKMQRSRLVTKLVVDVDDDAIADIGLDLRNGPLVVDANDGTRERSVWIGRDPSDVEVVVDGSCAGEAQRGSEQSCYPCEAFHLVEGTLAISLSHTLVTETDWMIKKG